MLFVFGNDVQRLFGCGTVSGLLPSPPVSRSTWCRNGLTTPSSARPPSMPMPSERRKRTLPAGCGHDSQAKWGFPYPRPCVSRYMSSLRRPEWIPRSKSP